MTILRTGKGVEFIVSTADVASISAFNWHATAHGYIGTNMKIDGRWRTKKLHRWLLRVEDPNVFVDHIDGDPLNNSRENLRLASREQNAANQKSRAGTSAYKGVSRLAQRNERSWRVSLRAQVVGHFATEVEAALAYDAAARVAYGDFARLNFPAVHLAPHGTTDYRIFCAGCGAPATAANSLRKYCSARCGERVRRCEKRLGVFG